MSDIRCTICPHACLLKEGETGKCRGRRNVNGKNVCDNGGRITSLCMDPIEKKPFAMYHPGRRILSAGSYGCNLSCPFCQNWTLSMLDENTVNWRYFSPEELAQTALEQPYNLGIAFTYNEPLISYDYIIETAKLLIPQGKKIVLVTNGTINLPQLMELMPYVDAMNIDLKGPREYYKELGGFYDTVHQTIAYAAKHCHVEVTTLVVPGKSDDPAWVESEAEWLASVDENIPLHLSRYFPRYHSAAPATGVQKIYELQKIAQKHLKNVFTGNIW